MKVGDTNGIPYKATFSIGFPYMITTNINVADGLANGAIGDLHHIEYVEARIMKRIWLRFPRVARVSRKVSSKYAAHP